ncbi:MAG: HEPN domain-containing protein [Rhizobiales bacterium]|nr:HEPN domain-containing protein [Hyphomicrobiales bacterium]
MDEAARELVRDWLTRADHDLRSARALASLADPLLDTAIYHCQQAAEKSIKAWLQGQDEPFPKTHDVAELVKQAAEFNPGFGKIEKAAAVLTPYASAFRYPGGAYEPMPTREEFDEALQLAQSIYDFVVNLLPKEARP